MVPLPVQIDLTHIANTTFDMTVEALKTIPNNGVGHKLRKYYLLIHQYASAWQDLVGGGHPIGETTLKDFRSNLAAAFTLCTDLQRVLTERCIDKFHAVTNQLENKICEKFDALHVTVQLLEDLVKKTTMSVMLGVVPPEKRGGTVNTAEKMSGMVRACRCTELHRALFDIQNDLPLKTTLQSEIVNLSIAVLGQDSIRVPGGLKRFAHIRESVMMTFEESKEERAYSIAAGILKFDTLVSKDLVRLYLRCDPSAITLIEQCARLSFHRDTKQNKDKVLRTLEVELAKIQVNMLPTIEELERSFDRLNPRQP